MAGLIDELMDTLDKENEEYQQLLKLAKEKTEIIVRGDIEALQKITEQEQLMMDRIAPLEKKRIEYTKDIATVINRPVETLTITRMMELMESQPAVKNRLSMLHDKLHDTMREMVRTNDLNQSLLQQQLELVNFDITLLNSMKQAPLTANYDKSAYNTEQHLISRGAFDTRQ
ncbi:MAG: flagellar protein FlgN [Lachnospiraceae bacterium]|nr:flagellar protein FlgN [Lachnospiraceae bacterium]